MPEHDVNIRNVTKRFGSMTAVDAVDLDVPRGHFVTFLGPSGCGKTTTLRMIGGFEYPDSGEIAIRGEVMGNRPPHQRDTSMVFQNYALFPHMNVADNIGFGLRERKVPKGQIQERVSGMLNLVELPTHGSRKPRQLSGGQQQRVALARSLVVEPTVLLLDEPLGALDLKLRKQMQIELKHIQQRVGITFIYVTHDQEEALTMSDTIVVMNEGRVEQEGSAEEIFERPRTRFVAAFMGAENILDARVVDRDSASSRLKIGPGEITVNTAMPPDARTTVVVIRPEKVRLDVADGWPATVRDRVYKGSVVSYMLTLEDGTGVTADVSHDDPAHRHSVGDKISVGFRTEDLVVIPDGGKGA
jgi:spermidine/putrescine transport system ATP-binding protein